MRIRLQPVVVAGLALVLAACIPASRGRPGGIEPGPAISPGLDSASAVPAATGPSAPPSFVRPTPTAQPTFFAYVVKRGDTLTSIARAHRTTARSIAFWNRVEHPSLDSDSSSYAPNRIEIGWILLLVPDLELDPEELEPEPTPAPSPTPYSPYGG